MSGSDSLVGAVWRTIFHQLLTDYYIIISTDNGAGFKQKGLAWLNDFLIIFNELWIGSKSENTKKAHKKNKTVKYNIYLFHLFYKVLMIKERKSNFYQVDRRT